MIRHSLAFAVLILLFGSAAARADQIVLITIINATYQATCNGGVGTCTEIVNGTIYGDVTTEVVYNASLQLTGSLTASLDGFFSGTGTCIGPNCLDGAFYDLSALPGYNPIEFSPTLDTIPTSVPLQIDPTDSSLFIPGMCGGDQANCNQTGDFPSGADYPLQSGTYTAVVTPEPSAIILVLTGLAGVFLFQPKRRYRD